MTFWIILILVIMVALVTPARNFFFAYGRDADFIALVRNFLFKMAVLVLAALLLWAVLPKF